MRPPDSTADPPRTLLIACGALAHEIVDLVRVNGWQHMSVQCLPADLHNRPERIPGAVREQIRQGRQRFERVFVAYADCGTGGLLDRVLEEESVERLPGAHCYEFYAGRRDFAMLHEAEPGTLYLTDFLARHFDRLIWKTLGLERHPELITEYFRNYRRVIYLSQTRSPALLERARDAARRLGLQFEHRDTGYGELGVTLGRVAAGLSATPSDSEGGGDG
jgi:hypothetical protein